MDARAYFKDKKITVMGLGLLGRGVGDVKFLAECGADVIVTDLKSEAELAPSLEQLKGFSNVRFVSGHKLEDFRNRDLVLKAPKTPSDSSYIQEAEKYSVPVTMSTALATRLVRETTKATIIGVTGTRGKTTVTQMVAHILRTLGKKVVVGGNVQGVSTLALLPEITDDTYLVLELDSWQLQGFRAEKLSPHIAVFTTFFPDHMDYYKNDMDLYLGDKAGIFLHQTPNDVLVLGAQVKSLIEEKYTPSSTIVDGVSITESLQVLGAHNAYNAGLAVSAVAVCGISKEEAEKAVSSFAGVSGRLEFVREVNGVKIYNDTTATTPEATIAALQTLDAGKNIILIMGGSDKGLSMEKLLPEIKERTKRVIMLSGTGTNMIVSRIEGASIYDGLKEAFEEAMRFSVAGDVVLLSPAFASFGMFKNEYERGDQFVALAKSYG